MKSLIPPIVAVLFATSASADAGEVYYDLSIAVSGASLTNPWASSTQAFDEHSAFAVLPGVQLGGRVGLTNSLHVGIGIDGGFALGTMSSGAKVEGFSGSLLANHYRGHLPLSLSWRMDTGNDLSALLELGGGPTFVYWQNYALIDPTTLDADGLPVSVPVDLDDAWYLGGTGSLSVLFEWRIGNHFVLAAGPTASVSYLGGVTASAGIMLRPSLVFGHPFL